MNINNLLSSLQPILRMQKQMQDFDKKFYKLPLQMREFQKRFDLFPKKMLEMEKRMLSFSSIYDNEALIKLRQVKKELRVINERNATITMFMAQYKDLQNITQTFYGLQFSTTIKKNNQTETQTTQAFYHETTISQAEHTRILSEKDYLISTQQTIIIQLQTKNKELLTENKSVKYQIQCTSQDFKTKLSIQNSSNAKQKGYPELKKWILEIAEQPQIKNISKPSKQALEIERIIKFHSKEYNTVMQSKISKPINLHNYIKEVLKKQV